MIFSKHRSKWLAALARGIGGAAVALESRWGVVLGESVQVTLRDHAKALEAKIEWEDRGKASHHIPPRFRLRGVEFGHEEIESIVQQDD